MSVKKILIGIATVTLFSLFYVFQQSEIFRLAYIGQRQQSNVDDLLDDNKLLRYNIQSRSSLVHLGADVLKTSNFQLPQEYRIVKSVSLEEPAIMQAKAKQETFFSRIFGIKRQAVAKTINP